jgi:hypothetical protein
MRPRKRTSNNNPRRSSNQRKNSSQRKKNLLRRRIQSLRLMMKRKRLLQLKKINSRLISKQQLLVLHLKKQRSLILFNSWKTHLVPQEPMMRKIYLCPQQKLNCQILISLVRLRREAVQIHSFQCILLEPQEKANITIDSLVELRHKTYQILGASRKWLFSAEL